VILLKIPKEIKERSGTNNTKNKMCSVEDCTKNAIRNLSLDEYENYLLLARIKYYRNRTGRVYLCREHFNVVNKEKKSEKFSKQKKGFLENKNRPKRTWY